MFLHLGEGEMIPIKEIVMIGDLKSANDSEITREFFKISEEEGFIIDYSAGKARSFIMTGETIYLSLISSTTLLKRIEQFPENCGGE